MKQRALRAHGAAALFSLALLAAPRATLAQPSTAADREAEAKAYFLSGVELLKTGRVESALEQFLRSRAVFARGKNTINAAICLERLGRFDEALVLYEEVRDQRSAELDTEDRDKLAPIIKNLSSKVGSLAVTANVPDANLQVDGKPRGALGAPLRLLPGRHVVRVAAEGYSTFTSPIDVGVGEALKVSATLERLSRVGVLRVEDPESEGADVFVDQVLVGQIPWEGVVSVGPHVVLQRRGDRGSKPSSATVLEGQTSLVRLRAEELGPSVNLSVEPPSARLSIDGVSLGNGSWEGRLPRGRYSFRAEEPGYLMRELAFELAGNAQTIRLRLVIDEEHERWPKPAKGELFAGAFAGAALGGGLGSGAELDCPAHCSENNPALGFLVGGRFGYRFTTGTAIEALGGYAAATTSVLREVSDTFSAAGSKQPIRYGLSEVIDVTFPFVGLGVSQRARLVGPLSLVARVSGGVAFARASTTIEANARTNGSAVAASVNQSDEPAAALPFVEPELGLEVKLGNLRFTGAFGVWALAATTPNHGARTLAVSPNPDPNDPSAVGNAPYSDAIANERGAGVTWLFTPQVGVAYGF